MFNVFLKNTFFSQIYESNLKAVIFHSHDRTMFLHENTKVVTKLPEMDKLSPPITMNNK